MPFIDKAIEQAKKFPGDENELVDNIGCNLWKLMEELKKYPHTPTSCGTPWEYTDTSA